MSDIPKKLYMARFPVDQRRLYEFARRRGISLDVSDAGYTLHCILTELFGPEFAPKPYAAQPATGAILPVLAYTGLTKNELEARAKECSINGTYSLVDWNGFSVKAMPAHWLAGRQFGFEVRVCPVERKNKAGEFNRHAGAEVDVYLGHVFKHKKDIDRGMVYGQWTKSMMEKPLPEHAQAVRVIEITTRGFRRVTFIRRDRDRKAVSKERPEAFVTGILEVADSAAFAALLQRGIGRHRAFGFGMLLLKPVD